jgi:hypothetical protein
MMTLLLLDQRNGLDRWTYYYYYITTNTQEELLLLLYILLDTYILILMYSSIPYFLFLLGRGLCFFVTE